MPARSAATVLHQIVSLRVSRIRPMKGQPRKYFNRHKLKKLMTSLIKAGQKLPILVRPIEGDPNHDWELIDGERRWRGKKLEGAEYIAGIVFNGEDAEEFFEISAIANFGRESHTPLEIANALQRVRERRINVDGNCSEADLADMFAQTTTWVSHHLSLLKLTPEVKMMMSHELPTRKRLNRTAAVQVSRLPAKEQAAFARQILAERMSLNQVRLEVRTALQEKSDADAPLVFRGRPVNRLRSLVSTLDNFSKNAGVLLGIPRAELHEALADCSPKERAEVRRLLRECQSKQAQLSEAADQVFGRHIALVSSS